MSETVSTGVSRAVFRAGDLVERSGRGEQPELLVEAIAELRAALLEPMPGRQRAEVEHELGIVFCLLAQTKGEARVAMPMLDRAIRHFNAALAGMGEGARSAAMIQANMAIAHLTRHGWSDTAADLMGCQIALDRAADGFTELGEAQWLAWIEDIRAHLRNAQTGR